MSWLRRLNEGPKCLELGQVSLELLHWAYAPRFTDNVPHRHTHFEVCLVGRRGRGRFWVEEAPHEVGPGDLFIARPGVVHQVVNTGDPGMELYWVAFACAPASRPTGRDAAGLGALLRAFAASPVLVAPDSDGRVAALWRTLHHLVQGKPQLGHDAQLTGVMTALLIAIAQAGAGSPLLPETVPLGLEGARAPARMAVLYIHDNLGRALSVTEVAAHVHTSPRQLSRLFVTFTGTSPAAYIEQARLERARHLLCRTTKPIKTVATMVGYDSVHHFTRVFSRRFGLPPGAFRHQHEQTSQTGKSAT
jgi:AraC family L-rhamnose operon transcriptional activator RhaR